MFECMPVNGFFANNGGESFSVWDGIGCAVGKFGVLA